VPAKWLRAVADVLRDYHRQPEYKFLAADGMRRACCAAATSLPNEIEISARRLMMEEDDARTGDQDIVLTYPSSSTDRERMVELIKSVGKRELARKQKSLCARLTQFMTAVGAFRMLNSKRMANAANGLKRGGESITKRRRDL